MEKLWKNNPTGLLGYGQKNRTSSKTFRCSTHGSNSRSDPKSKAKRLTQLQLIPWLFITHISHKSGACWSGAVNHPVQLDLLRSSCGRTRPMHPPCCRHSWRGFVSCGAAAVLPKTGGFWKPLRYQAKKETTGPLGVAGSGT